MDQIKPRLRLGKRIRGGFNKVTLVIIAMMLISIAASLILASYAKGIYDGPYQRMVVVGKIELGLENLQRNLYTCIAEDEPDLVQASMKQIDINLKELDENVTKLKTLTNESEAVEINLFDKKIKSAYSAIDRVNSFVTNSGDQTENDMNALFVMRHDAIPIFNSAYSSLDQLKNQSEKAASDYIKNTVLAQFAVVGFMALLLIVSIVVSSIISKRLEKEIITPVEELVNVSTMLSHGEIDVDITYNKENELGVLADSMRNIIAALKDLISESNSLSQAAVAGDLESRGDADKFQGSYREIIMGVNNTLDALIKPLKASASYMELISRGEIPEKIIEDAQGDYREIQNSINTCIDAVNRLISDTDELVGAAIYGRLNQRADSSCHGGDFVKIIDGVNKTIDTLVGHIDKLPSPVMILNGEYEIEYINRSGAELTGISAEELTGVKCYEAFPMDACNSDDFTAMEPVMQGEDIAGDTALHLNEADLEITYTGIPLRNENAEVIGALLLILDQTQIKKAALFAEQNVEIARKQAEYQEREVNQLIVNLEKLALGDINIEIVDMDAEKDEDTAHIAENFKKINTYLERCAAAIKALIDDVSEMTKAAIGGQLDHRSDTDKHGGSFAMIIGGLNDTLDAVVEPIGAALSVLQAMEYGDLHTKMEGEYNGDYAVIKTTMNETIQNIDNYISEISNVLTEIAKGNLNLSITADYRGDFVVIKDSLNNIITTMSQVMGEISVSAEQVSSGARQVSDGSQTLSQGSTLQASSIEELTASIAEIAAQTKKNAVSAGQAHELASTVKVNAEQGNEQMQDMLSSMVAINDSSINISKIIKVIDDIAFQTNILALNAAVEAARAGQHGKGFAVVAEEVRNLAARSADAARETTELIEGSVRKVEAGTKIANETAAALNEIVSGIEKAADIVGEIASASNEQASAIAQVNKGVEQVSDVVQNNSATAEESAAASEELSGQAELLKQMVGRFQLNQAAETLTETKPKLLAETQKGTAERPVNGKSAKIILSGSESDKY